MNKFDIVYANNSTLGYFIDGSYKIYNKEELEKAIEEAAKYVKYQEKSFYMYCKMEIWRLWKWEKCLEKKKD